MRSNAGVQTSAVVFYPGTRVPGARVPGYPVPAGTHPGYSARWCNMVGQFKSWFDRGGKPGQMF
eukprot:3907722-Rhodomonas_salina.1